LHSTGESMSNNTRFFKRAAALAIGALGLVSALPATAGPFRDPTVFASKAGLLNLLMIAEARPNPALAPFYPGQDGQGPESWVYRICRDPVPGANECPAGSSVAEYGGVRFALKRGDRLKIRLVNHLPVSDQFKNASLLGPELSLNPTNLHTHGLLVEPRVPTLNRNSYGDNIFVLTYNSKNGVPAANTTHNHGDVRADFTDYEIDIPSDHPLGSFWFHPHAHGVSLNQVSAGMSGIITIGEIGDYACADASCRLPLQEAAVRHLILKDTQIEQDTASGNNGILSTQEDPGFCDPTLAPKDGYCDGVDVHSGGKWFFSLSGQIKPSITVSAADGEAWRLTNSSASVTYDLHLSNDATNQDMIFQLLAVDGVTVSPTTAFTPGQMVRMGGGKFKVVSCPGATGGMARQPVCVSSLTMYPSSRVEIWVTYRDAHGLVATPPAGASATFRTIGFQTGETGDSWPATDLAAVQFRPSGPRTFASDFVHLRPGANILLGLGAIFETAAKPSTVTPRTASCAPLPQGYHRRVYYGVPNQLTYPGVGFGLGYEIVDPKGQTVPNTTVDITPFDPNVPIICVPLGTSNSPIKEVWELVNTATEDHNFHIHQTKFRVVDLKAQPASPLYAASMFLHSLVGGASPQVVLHDNIPLPSATGSCDNGIADWKSGACTSTPVTVEIPFKFAGDFVYHCHILEHEDGGMMAKIRVASNP
jgi:L-ascorbate oxidase